MLIIKDSERTLRSGCPDCGSRNVYRGHDVDKGTPVLIEATDYTRSLAKGEFAPDVDVHVCQADAVDSHSGATAAELPAPAPAQSADDDPAALMAKAMRAMVGTPQIDRAEVEAIAREVIEGIAYPTRTIVDRGGERREVEGLTHSQLADVTTAIMAGEHVMMVGPAGTGKSTIAHQAAEAMGLESYALSLSPQTPASQIVGYMQATGDYVPTLFRQAYEHGGVFHFDEIDNAHPSVLAVVNAALANGHMAFPDQMVKRHDDFRCVASANTYGRGATRAYVGRQAIDAATLDRFAVITIEIDEALEHAVAMASGLEATQVDRVLTAVRGMRERAESQGLNVVISPRASAGMCKLLAAGMSWAQAEDMRLRRGLDDATWHKLLPA